MYSCFQHCSLTLLCFMYCSSKWFHGEKSYSCELEVKPYHKPLMHNSKPPFPRFKNLRCAAPRQCVCFESSLIPVWLLWQPSSGEHHSSAAKGTEDMTRPIQPTHDFVLRAFISMWIERYWSRKFRITEEDEQNISGSPAVSEIK